MPVKILSTADLHIGRRSSRLPAGVDARVLSCAEAWARVVELAVAERVDVVAVAGDLVDRQNRFYEAAGPVEQGLRRLDEAGIATVMVAGNHDFDTLPWLVDGIGSERVRLLGRGGRWERFTLERGGEAVHFDGWSFPAEAVHVSPLGDYPFERGDAPVVGLLHADLDQAASRYAPVAYAELAQRARLWLLGHLHQHRSVERDGTATVLYPGSPQAMDPGEVGPHGVWLCELGRGLLQRRFVPLSRVRYEQLVVDVGGTEELGEVGSRLVEAVRASLASAVEESGVLRYLSLRVRAAGRTPLHGQLLAWLGTFGSELELRHGDASAVIESVAVHTRPAYDLGELARGNDAPAVLARLVVALDAGAPTDAERALLREAARRASEVRGARPYVALGAAPAVGAADGEITDELRSQALVLLDALLSQKEQPA